MRPRGIWGNCDWTQMIGKVRGKALEDLSLVARLENYDHYQHVEEVCRTTMMGGGDNEKMGMVVGSEPERLASEKMYVE